jgi:transcriptional regulator with XRE-family HTH domain
MEKKIETVFGAAIRRRREAQKISQEAFADKAGIHRTYVSSVELGKVQVGIGVAHKLAVALGVPLSDIWKEVEKELTEGGPDQGAPP